MYELFRFPFFQLHTLERSYTQLVVCFQKINCTKHIFLFFFSLKCPIIRETFRYLGYKIKKKIYPLAPSGNLNIQLSLTFTSSGSSFPVEGISADRLEQHGANIVFTALGQKSNWCKSTYRLEQEGRRVLLLLLAAATWLLGTERGRAGKGKLGAKVLWKQTSGWPEGLWEDCT